MSSMLKKTGGLSFKPKVGRRPGAAPKTPAVVAPPAPTPPPTSNSATKTPSTEPQPQPLPREPSSIAPQSTDPVVEPPETVVPGPGKQTTRIAHPPSTRANLQTPSASEPRDKGPTVQSAAKPVLSEPEPPTPPVVRKPIPQSSIDTPGESPPRQRNAPAVDSTIEGERTVPSVEGVSVNANASGLPQPGTAAPSSTRSEPSSLAQEVATIGPLTAPPSPPPVPETILATSEPKDPAAPAAPAAPKPRKQAPRKRKSAAADSTTKDAGDSEPKQKRPRKKPVVRETSEASSDANTEAQKAARRRRREPTPENAEELTVDHSKMTVGELTKDLGIGKRFKHAEEIEQRAREARAKYRQKRLEREKRKRGLLPPEDDDDLESQPDTSIEGEGRGAAIAQLGASMESGDAQGVGYEVINGQIVVHAASLVVNRHNQDMSNLEEVEENDFTNLVNSNSFAKRVQTAGNWTDEETEKFYRLLGMFGTDFETISRLFPGKNRRAVKLKFNKEERLRPNRVNAAMMVRGQKKVNIDIEEYKAAQRQWEAKEKILEENARLAEEQEREVARLRDERRAAGLIDDDDSNTSKTSPPSAKDTPANDDEFEVIEEDADQLGQESTEVVDQT
ncbi:hypothetical protein GGS20DRAFT_353410 [Poronia punctata]|nr:hypothetical protein GGS20DRAFT_353410 [Poronia punctata]